MKKILYSLLTLSVLTTSTMAATHPVHRKVVKLPKMTKLSGQEAAELSARSLQLTCYLTDVLRLSSKQAAEVRRVTLQELQQSGLDSKQAVAAYDAALLRILTSGQYSTFRWLEERQPVANLLQSPLAVEATQR